MRNENFQFVVKILSCDKKTLGTGFFCGKNCIFTARHVIAKQIIDGINNFFCKLSDDSISNIEIIYENLEYDIAVFKTDIDHDTIDIPTVAYSVAEIDDKYTVAGYPAVSQGAIDIISGHVIREESSNPNIIYALYISNQRENATWEGLSGAPVIIENEIAGVVLKTDEGNQKPKILASSIEGILELIGSECPDILKNIKRSSSTLVTNRIDDFYDQLKNIFNFSKSDTKYGNIDIFILKNSKKLKPLAELVINAVEYYGVTLTEYKNSQSGDIKIKREADKYIRITRSNILKVLLTENHIAYIILWVLIEGFKKNPRVGTRINANNKYLSTDIYIHDDTMKIFFSEAIKEKDFLNSLNELFQRIDSYIQDGKPNIKNEILEYDEVVLSNLSYDTRKKLYNLKVNQSGKINIGIYSLVLFEYFNIYKQGVSENQEIQKQILLSLIESLNDEIEELVKLYDWIDTIDIKYFKMPVSDFTLFENHINDLLTDEGGLI